MILTRVRKALRRIPFLFDSEVRSDTFSAMFPRTHQKHKLTEKCRQQYGFIRFAEV